MFNKLLYLLLIITKRKKLMTYNNSLKNKCNYTISNVISWIIIFLNSCKNLLYNDNC